MLGQILTLLVIGSFPIVSHAQEVEKTLCVDIGATRVKAAVLYPEISLEELQEISTIEFNSEGWLNESLPQIFNPSVPESLIQRIKCPFNRISFGITGLIMDSRTYILPERGIPYHLKQKCEEEAGVECFAETDTVIWTRGAMHWQKLIGQKITFPCLGITLGTGIGIVVLRSATDTPLLQTSLFDVPFKRFRHLCKDQTIEGTYDRLNRHELIGIPFFEWAKNQKFFESEEQINEEYNLRIIAFLEDMKEFLKNDLNININSIMIGGGNSRFISLKDLQTKLNSQIILLSPQHISQFGISPDIISLLGCLASPNCPSVEMLPSWEVALEVYTHSF